MHRANSNLSIKIEVLLVVACNKAFPIKINATTREWSVTGNSQIIVALLLQSWTTKCWSGILLLKLKCPRHFLISWWQQAELKNYSWNSRTSRMNFELKLCTVSNMYLYFRNMKGTKHSRFFIIVALSKSVSALLQFSSSPTKIKVKSHVTDLRCKIMP